MKEPASLGGRSSRHYKRADLFLVRIWTEDARPQDGARAMEEVRSSTVWGGKVQRVVDGESHQFSGWQGLIDALVAMLVAKQQAHGREDAGHDQDNPGTA